MNKYVVTDTKIEDKEVVNALKKYCKKTGSKFIDVREKLKVTK